MCSVLVEQGLLLRLTRTSMQMVADLTCCLSRLMMVISDRAKRLLIPSEFVDEITMEDPVPLGLDRFYDMPWMRLQWRTVRVTPIHFGCVRFY
jgi:hypothetical protein